MSCAGRVPVLVASNETTHVWAQRDVLALPGLLGAVLDPESPLHGTGRMSGHCAVLAAVRDLVVGVEPAEVDPDSTRSNECRCHDVQHDHRRAALSAGTSSDDAKVETTASAMALAARRQQRLLVVGTLSVSCHRSGSASNGSMSPCRHRDSAPLSALTRRAGEHARLGALWSMARTVQRYVSMSGGAESNAR